VKVGKNLPPPKNGNDRLMVFHISHVMRYSYSRPVFLEPQTFRLIPRTDGAQKLIDYDITIKPTPAGQSRYLDIEGNICIYAWFSGLTDSFEIHSISKTATFRENPFGYILSSDEYKKVPLNYPGNLKSLLLPCLENSSEDLLVQDLANTIMEESNGDTLTFLNNLTSYIYKNFKVTIREEGDPYSPEKTLQGKTGACRDLTILFIECCRYAGIAARFVSGYHTGDPKSHEHYLHAWAEVYLPGGGWRGYDPTLGLAVADMHIAIAASAHSLNASPITGSFRGTGVRQIMKTDLKIEIS
jgi:transglutaminase-like putative cysteine protease